MKLIMFCLCLILLSCHKKNEMHDLSKIFSEGVEGYAFKGDCASLGEVSLSDKVLIGQNKIIFMNEIKSKKCMRKIELDFLLTGNVLKMTNPKLLSDCEGDSKKSINSFVQIYKVKMREDILELKSQTGLSGCRAIKVREGSV